MNDTCKHYVISKSRSVDLHYREKPAIKRDHCIFDICCIFFELKFIILLVILTGLTSLAV